jgi:hypothetical protein
MVFTSYYFNLVEILLNGELKRRKKSIPIQIENFTSKEKEESLEYRHRAHRSGTEMKGTLLLDSFLTSIWKFEKHRMFRLLRENNSEERMTYGAERIHKNSLRPIQRRNKFNESLSEDEEENYKQHHIKRQSAFLSKMPRDSDDDGDNHVYRSNLSRDYEERRPNSTLRNGHGLKTRKVVDSDEDSDREVSRERRPYKY